MIIVQRLEAWVLKPESAQLQTVTTRSIGFHDGCVHIININITDVIYILILQERQDMYHDFPLEFVDDIIGPAAQVHGWLVRIGTENLCL